MSVFDHRQLSTKPCLLRKAERSSGTEFRTLSFVHTTGMLMTKESPSSIPGARRAARIAAAAGLAAALAASGASPVLAADDPAVPPVKPAATSAEGDKLGEADADVLAKAEAKGEKNITMMVATTPGATEKVAEQLDSVKGSVVGQTYDKFGYVRTTVRPRVTGSPGRSSRRPPEVTRPRTRTPPRRTRTTRPSRRARSTS